jgi:CheY-like chemotaxis protein
VLVCDIGLPERDGYDVIREARDMQPADRPRLPAVALTAFTRTEDRARALEAGFDLHVPKPLKPHVLLAALAILRPPPDASP